MSKMCRNTHSYLLLIQVLAADSLSSIRKGSIIHTCTGRMGWMAHRKWKDNKQQPSMLPGPTVPGCYLLSFLRPIHPIRPVIQLTPHVGPLACGGPRVLALSIHAHALYACPARDVVRLYYILLADRRSASVRLTLSPTPPPPTLPPPCQCTVLRGVNFWVRKCVKIVQFNTAQPRVFPLSVGRDF